MKSAVLLIAFATISLLSCKSSGNDAADKEKISYEQTKKVLLEKEQKSPALFLTAEAARRKNIIGQTVVSGKISNNATLAIYKDVRIQLNFFSKTKTHLDTEDEVIYIELRPGQTEDFKTKYFAPKGTDSVAVTVLDAKSIPL